MHRTALIDQIQQAREPLEKLLTLLQSVPVERDQFVSHLYRARKAYRRTCETSGKSRKQIERLVLSTLQIAERLDCKGESRKKGRNCSVWRKGRAYRPPTAKNFALKDPLKSDVCQMASANRAIVGEEVL
jgi:hypothetical protein